MTTRALIIEDNPINRELLDCLLQASGFETLTAVDGAVGLEVARRERPDIILCDIQMPVMGGMEFAAVAKADAQLRDIPLLAITALAMMGDSDRVLAGGFDGYLTKPFDPHTLVAKINAYLPQALRVGANASPPAAPDDETPAVPVGTSPLVLVLDDTPANLALKRALLEPHGYEVRTAQTATEAILLALARIPALIISDVGMQEGNGFDFLREVKADPRLRDIPFIFLSSTHFDDVSMQVGLKLGAIRYLRRPLAPERVLEEVDRIFGRTAPR